MAARRKVSCNINDIIARTAYKTDCYQQDIAPVVKAVFESIADYLMNQETVYIHNFGEFRLKLLPGRTVIHPVTKEPCRIEPHYRVEFSPFPKLNEKMRDIPILEEQKE